MTSVSFGHGTYTFTSNALVYRVPEGQVSVGDPVEERFIYNAQTAVWTKRRTREIWRPVVIVKIKGGLAHAAGARAQDMSLIVAALEPYNVPLRHRNVHIALPVPFCAPVYADACALVGLVVQCAPCDQADGGVSELLTPVGSVGVSQKKFRTLCRNWPHAEVSASFYQYVSLKYTPPLMGITSSTMMQGVEEDDEDDDGEDEHDSEDPTIAGHVAAGIDIDAPLGTVARDGTRKGTAPIRTTSARAAVVKAATEVKFLNANVQVLYVDMCGMSSKRRPDRAKSYVSLLNTDGEVSDDDKGSDTHTVASSAMTVYGETLELGPDGLPIHAHDLSDVDVCAGSDDEDKPYTDEEDDDDADTLDDEDEDDDDEVGDGDDRDERDDGDGDDAEEDIDDVDNLSMTSKNSHASHDDGDEEEDVEAEVVDDEADDNTDEGGSDCPDTDDDSDAALSADGGGRPAKRPHKRAKKTNDKPAASARRSRPSRAKAK